MKGVVSNVLFKTCFTLTDDVVYVGSWLRHANQFDDLMESVSRLA